MDRIVVCVCFDIAYAPFGCVCIYSLLKHNPTALVKVITVPEERNELEAIIKSLHLPVEILVPELDFIQKTVAINNAKGITGYLRLSIPSLLQEYERILYLDADILVQANLSSLWQEDLSNFMFAAAADGGYPDISKKHPQFNSGVMLLNMKRIIQENFQDKMLTYLKNERSNLNWQFGDQEAMYILFKEYCKIIDGKWNVLYKVAAQSLNTPPISILHFAGLSKLLLMGEITQSWAAEWYTALDTMANKSSMFRFKCITTICKLLESTHSVVKPLIMQAYVNSVRPLDNN